MPRGMGETIEAEVIRGPDVSLRLEDALLGTHGVSGPMSPEGDGPRC